MAIIYVLIIFFSIMAVLYLKKPLWLSLLVGIIITALVSRMSLQTWLRTLFSFSISQTNWSILLSMYLITFLQRILEKKKAIQHAEADLDYLFHNRRVNASVASLFIGLLPSAAAMLLCADIVKGATKDYLKPDEQAFVTSWFRHIPESSLPTYPSVLLMASLSGVSLGVFLPYMLLPMGVLYLIGYLFYLRKLPKDMANNTSNVSKQEALLNLVKHLWTLLLVLGLILVGQLPVVIAIIITIILALLYYKIPRFELKQMAVSAIEYRLLSSVFMVLLFKEFLASSRLLEELPLLLQDLPIPLVMIFAILFFIGGIVSGASGIIAIGTPIAFTALPDGGVALMVLLMSVAHAASQLSPTHVCLTVVSEYYHVRLGQLIRRTLPASFLFIMIMFGYYYLLTFL